LDWPALSGAEFHFSFQFDSFRFISEEGNQNNSTLITDYTLSSDFGCCCCWRCCCAVGIGSWAWAYRGGPDNTSQVRFHARLSTIFTVMFMIFANIYTPPSHIVDRPKGPPIGGPAIVPAVIESAAIDLHSNSNSNWNSNNQMRKEKLIENLSLKSDKQK